MNREQLFRAICKFHSGDNDFVGLFNKLNVKSVESLYDKGSGMFFPSDDNPEIFFVLKTFDYLGETLPSVESFTSFTKSIDWDNFNTYLRRQNERVWILLESYNHNADTLVDHFSIQDTSYCQLKLLCGIDDVVIQSSKRLKGDFYIRNFIPRIDRKLYKNLYNGLLGHLGTTADDDFIASIVESNSFLASGYFLAESAGTVVGFLAIEKRPWDSYPIPDKCLGYIYQIGVKAEYQGSGLSDLLLDHALAFARKNRITHIGVGVNKSNIRARQFFIKRNFEEQFEINGLILRLDS